MEIPEVKYKLPTFNYETQFPPVRLLPGIYILFHFLIRECVVRRLHALHYLIEIKRRALRGKQSMRLCRLLLPMKNPKLLHDDGSKRLKSVLLFFAPSRRGPHTKMRNPHLEKKVEAHLFSGGVRDSMAQKTRSAPHSWKWSSASLEARGLLFQWDDAEKYIGRIVGWKEVTPPFRCRRRSDTHKKSGVPVCEPVILQNFGYFIGYETAFHWGEANFMSAEQFSQWNVTCTVPA